MTGTAYWIVGIRGMALLIALNQLDARDTESSYLQRAGIAAPLVDVGALVGAMDRRDG